MGLIPWKSIVKRGQKSAYQQLVPLDRSHGWQKLSVFPSHVFWRRFLYINCCYGLAWSICTHFACRCGHLTCFYEGKVCVYQHINPQTARPKVNAFGIQMNSSDTRDGIFRLIWSISCLLMPWFLKSIGRLCAWYWQYKIGNISGWCIVIYLFLY